MRILASAILRPSCALLLAGATCVSVAQENTFRRGFDLLVSGDAEAAVAVWRTLARDGDLRAQFAMGVVHFEAKGVARDYAQSARWFTRAAQQGYAPAQFNLGNSHRNGHGVAQDDELASRWWKAAAEQELAEAQFNLGTSYYFGRGVEVDRDAARDWFRRAAENGSEQARRVLDFEPEVGLEPRRIERESWILEQDGLHYTIQLFAGTSEQAILGYAEQYPLRGPVAYFRATRNNQPWYSLVYGVYSGPAEARRELATLGGPLRTASPWIRSFASIQEALADAEPAGSR